MNRIDVFADGRKTPKISVNVKIKVKTSDINETVAWNKAFGYIMKKQRTKLEFLAVDSLRCLSLDKVKLKDIANLITEEDYADSFIRCSKYTASGYQLTSSSFASHSFPCFANLYQNYSFYNTYSFSCYNPCGVHF